MVNMPRIVHIDTSENNMKENEMNESVNANTNTTGRSEENLERSNKRGNIVTFYQENDENIENEERLYSLKCVVNGSIKLFKKDTRIWLHKSSEKGIRKNEQDSKCCGDVPPLKIGRFENTDQTAEIIDVEHREHSIEDTMNNVTNSAGNYNLYRSGHSNISSELSSLADSDADLAYSEESTPNESPDINKSAEICASLDSTETNVTKAESRLTDFNEDGLHAELNQNSDSLDSLDIYDESANNITSYPTDQEISRKLAPAIDIDDESIQHNLLDNAINLRQACNSTFDTATCFTGAASKNNFRTDDRLQKKPKKRKNESDTITSYTGYCLRSKTTTNTGQRGSRTQDPPASKNCMITGKGGHSYPDSSDERDITNDDMNNGATNEIITEFEFGSQPMVSPLDSYTKHLTSSNSVTAGCSYWARPLTSPLKSLTNPLSLLYLATLAIYNPFSKKVDS